MKRLRLIRIAPVRYALAFAGLSTLAMGVLLAVIYWFVISLLERHVDIAVEQQQLALRNNFSHDGIGGMLLLVDRFLESGGGLLHYLVQDASGRVLGGDLPATQASEGWRELLVTAKGDDSAGETSRLRAYGAFFDENSYVLVAHDTKELSETRLLILRSFGLTLGATIIITLAGGLAIGTALLRRVEGASHTARAIMDGDLAQRIPVTGSGDEIDRLAEGLNRMLGRIEELMDNLRHVTSDIAHDLRTPLGRLRQRLEAARIKERSPAQYEEVIDAAIADTDTLLRTFDAMLRIAEIEAGAARARFAPVDLSAITENVGETFLPVAEDDGKRLEVNVTPDVAVHGDRELLMQMLVNLIENALRHTPRGTLIRLSLENLRDVPALVVADDGPGIPADERERVLRRFYRLDESRSSPGSGLGLSLIAAIAKLHGAELTLDDNRPGLRISVSFRTESVQ